MDFLRIFLDGFTISETFLGAMVGLFGIMFTILYGELLRYERELYDIYHDELIASIPTGNLKYLLKSITVVLLVWIAIFVAVCFDRCNLPVKVIVLSFTVISSSITIWLLYSRQKMSKGVNLDDNLIEYLGEELDKLPKVEAAKEKDERKYKKHIAIFDALLSISRFKSSRWAQTQLEFRLKEYIQIGRNYPADYLLEKLFPLWRAENNTDWYFNLFFAFTGDEALLAQSPHYIELANKYLLYIAKKIVDENNVDAFERLISNAYNDPLRWNMRKYQGDDNHYNPQTFEPEPIPASPSYAAFKRALFGIGAYCILRKQYDFLDYMLNFVLRNKKHSSWSERVPLFGDMKDILPLYLHEMSLGMDFDIFDSSYDMVRNQFFFLLLATKLKEETNNLDYQIGESLKRLAQDELNNLMFFNLEYRNQKCVDKDGKQSIKRERRDKLHGFRELMKDEKVLKILSPTPIPKLSRNILEILDELAKQATDLYFANYQVSSKEIEDFKKDKTDRYDFSLKQDLSPFSELGFLVENESLTPLKVRNEILDIEYINKIHTLSWYNTGDYFNLIKNEIIGKCKIVDEENWKEHLSDDCFVLYPSNLWQEFVLNQDKSGKYVVKGTSVPAFVNYALKDKILILFKSQFGKIEYLSACAEVSIKENKLQFDFTMTAGLEFKPAENFLGFVCDVKKPQ